MRDFKGMKRQRGRNRNGGSGGKPQQNANRAFESNGPEGVKVRGAAQHVYEKYMQLARDATMSGDRVLAENYLQHAEHYFRLIRTMQPQRPVADILGRDQFVSGFDIDFEEEPNLEALEGEAEAESGVTAEGGEGNGERGYASARRDDYRRDEYRRDDGRRDDGRRDDSRRDDGRTFESRSYEPRGEGRRDERRRDEGRRDEGRREEGRRDEGRAEWRSPEGGSRYGGGGSDRNGQERGERYADRVSGERSSGERSSAERSSGERGGERPSRREERPRYARDDRAPRYEAEGGAEDAVSDAPQTVLRAEDGDVSHAPAFLQARPVEAERTEERRPRRRRAAPVDAPPPESGED
jgi:hypothetical protein